MSTMKESSVSSLRGLSARLAGCLLAASLLIGHASLAHALAITVTSLADSGSGSLRDAITTANASSGSTISLAGLVGTITLASALPPIQQSMTITGPGSTLLAISGSGLYQIFNVAPASGTNITVNINGLNIANGKAAAGGGGGLYVGSGSTVTLNNDAFTGNSATMGGAVWNGGASLTISNSTFTGNTAGQTSSNKGGAVYSSAALTVKSSTFASNSAYDGSAIYLDPASTAAVSIVNSTFWANAAADTGAVYGSTSGNFSIGNSTFAGNTPLNAGGSIASTGAGLTVTNTILDSASACSGTSCPLNGTTGNVVGSVVVDLKLAPLGYYGGTTPTLLPLPGSAAIGAGQNMGGLPLTDQRGFPFTATVDAGAVQTNYVSVNTTADPTTDTCPSAASPSSLRDALGSGNGMVDIDLTSTRGTITLGCDLPAVTGSINLVGPGASSLTISAGGTRRLFSNNSGSLALLNLTLADGNSTGYTGVEQDRGGAILNSGYLTLVGDNFTNNSAGNVASSYGGVVDNTALVQVVNSSFSGNTAGRGSVIYNNSPTPLMVDYSTFSGNNAVTGGALYNNNDQTSSSVNRSGVMVITNSTFAGNTSGSGVGSGIYDTSALGNSLSLANTLIQDDATGAECYSQVNSGACTGTGSGNLILANTVTGSLAPLSNYGGGTPSILPLPGSAAICAGNPKLLLSGFSTEQRGFPNENTTYTGYSTTCPCVDAGAVQTNYTSVQFLGAPYVGTTGTPGTTPAVAVSVTENGQSSGGVPITLASSGPGTLTGIGPTLTVQGSGATFSSLMANQHGSYTLSVGPIAVVGGDSLSAGPVDLTINSPATPYTPAVQWAPPSSITYGTSLSEVLTADAMYNGSLVPGTFSYTYQSGASWVPATSATVLSVGTYTIQAVFTPGDPADYSSVTVQKQLQVAPETLTITANDASRVYGTANPGFTGSIVGAVNGDAFTETFSSPAAVTSNAGTYAIVPSVTGSNLSNYALLVTDGTLTVTKAATTTSLSVSGNSVNPGTVVTLTSTVVSATTGTPTGTVSFYDGSTLLGTATLTSGTASYTTSSLAAGATHSVSAVYDGDINFTNSTASASSVIVAPLTFTMQVTPATQTGNAGSTFTWQLTVAPSFGSYPGTVSFSANGLPQGASASFSPNGLAANSGQQTVTMTISTAGTTAMTQPFSPGRRLIPVTLALLFLPLAGTRRMRRNGRRVAGMMSLLLLALGGLAATTALTGCGSKANVSPAQQTYNITVTATSGTAQQTGAVTLNLL